MDVLEILDILTKLNVRDERMNNRDEKSDVIDISKEISVDNNKKAMLIAPFSGAISMA